ncbi:hypothetical protein GOODEAATRI_003307 [Goodea atripinnis]|uniref:Uncharacterized protein n=1 Tax=Goodea atripinnis TaxID=208336 RepID=A0ABV0PKN0_9TELE
MLPGSLRELCLDEYMETSLNLSSVVKKREAGFLHDSVQFNSIQTSSFVPIDQERLKTQLYLIEIRENQQASPSHWETVLRFKLLLLKLILNTTKLLNQCFM